MQRARRLPSFCPACTAAFFPVCLGSRRDVAHRFYTFLAHAHAQTNHRFAIKLSRPRMTDGLHSQREQRSASVSGLSTTLWLLLQERAWASSINPAACKQRMQLARGLSARFLPPPTARVLPEEPLPLRRSPPATCMHTHGALCVAAHNRRGWKVPTGTAILGGQVAC